jgi:hypothetical protein
MTPDQYIALCREAADLLNHMLDGRCCGNDRLRILKAVGDVADLVAQYTKEKKP